MKTKNRPLLRHLGVFAVLLIFWGSGFSASAASLPERLVPIGKTAGIKLFAPGVIVVKLSEVETQKGKAAPAKEGGILAGDIILSVGGKEVKENAELSSALEDRAGKKTEFVVLRGEKEKKVFVTPIEDIRGKVCIGASVRDSIAGLGTITYYDPETETFGALGHGICCGEGGELFPLGEGCLVPSSVVGINKGEAGKPGELLGVFDSNGDRGSILINSEQGIFGELEADELYPQSFSGDSVPLGRGIEKGKATILSNVCGETVGCYEVEIVKIWGADRETRNFQIRVTDHALLEATGGIVQGMSGSPIIQNGRLVGAVTHVSVNDPSMGYGIFIENMLDAAG